jgi:pimeloyl-ACP methyl ester carboxylesterase
VRRVVVAVVAVLLASLAALCVFHHTALRYEAAALDPPGRLVEVDDRSIHVYAEGDQDAPTLVFLAGAATIAPVYDFAPLSDALSGEYRTVVVEKTGYGYSDIEDTDRDVASLVAETREALRLAGEEAPYVLVPHSMSGLEALWWAQEYPEEVAAIIGLDMSTPESYAQQSDVSLAVTATAGKAATWLGLHRIPGLYPGMVWDGLTEGQQEQQRLLLYRNAGNIAHVRESQQVLDNAETVGIGATVPVPLLLFSSDGRDLDDRWVPIQEDLAESADADLIRLDCGHAVHQCAPDRIAERMNTFLLDALE